MLEQLNKSMFAIGLGLLSLVALPICSVAIAQNDAADQDSVEADETGQDPVLQEWPERMPEVAKGIKVDQKMGARLPMDLAFDDDHNNHIRIRDLFDGKKPVLLSFNYSNCPRLCIVQLNNLVAALNKINLLPGKDFTIVSVTLDPNEQIDKLHETKMKYLASYGKMETEGGWRFLRGDGQTIRKLADACGFQYKYIPDQRIYSHPSAFIFCSPDGQICRYLDGLDGELNTSLKPALMEAAEGKIGSLADKVLYFAGCYVFDPTTGKYSFAALSLMRVGGILTVVLILISVIPYWIGKRGRREAANDSQSGPDADSDESEISNSHVEVSPNQG